MRAHILRMNSMSSAQVSFFASLKSASILFSSSCRVNLLSMNFVDGISVPSRWALCVAISTRRLSSLLMARIRSRR